MCDINTIGLINFPKINDNPFNEQLSNIFSTIIFSLHKYLIENENNDSLDTNTPKLIKNFLNIIIYRNDYQLFAYCISHIDRIICSLEEKFSEIQSMTQIATLIGATSEKRKQLENNYINV